MKEVDFLLECKELGMFYCVIEVVGLIVIYLKFGFLWG